MARTARSGTNSPTSLPGPRRPAGEVRLTVEEMSTSADHFGLYTEEINHNRSNWAAIQECSPASLVSAAFGLDDALG